MSYSFLKKETFGLRTQETFVGKKCEIFLPEYYFNKGDDGAIAKELGDRVSTMGLFWFRIDDNNWYELQLPLKFEFEFSSSEKVSSFKIKPNLPSENYNVYILKNGDAFVYDILKKKDLDDFTKAFLGKMIENAKIPSTTSYNEIFTVFINAMDATGMKDIGVPAVSLEFLLSEIYRNKKNTKEPFRMSYNGNGYNYSMTRITKIPELNSTFTSLLGEDIQNQLVASILRTREKVQERVSPIEKVIKY